VTTTKQQKSHAKNVGTINEGKMTSIAKRSELKALHLKENPTEKQTTNLARTVKERESPKIQRDLPTGAPQNHQNQTMMPCWMETTLTST
jgi:hypothetical protein